MYQKIEFFNFPSLLIKNCVQIITISEFVIHELSAVLYGFREKTKIY